MKIWVLIIILYGPTAATAVTSVEFSSLEKCQEAAEKVTLRIPAPSAICVKK